MKFFEVTFLNLQKFQTCPGLLVGLV